ncbi:MAG: membrane integrity-associated transporter subunit PqiC [Alphaproteobacteria bacterium]|nr:membrane integrity-associated transporter subunit PqiC [Clostridia bacterium]MBR6663472.1 membrane integrity-associated transporter subunit PqiC [Alphaproteobacteria bacterium]
MKKVVFVALFLLAACVGTSSPSKFYVLNSISSTTNTFDSAKLFIGVGEVSVPMYLDKPQIVMRDKNQVELNISEFDRWSEPLGDAIQLALADDLAVYLPKTTVKPTSFREETFDYVVWVEINRFDGTLKQDVVLSAWWSIFDKNGKLVVREKSDLTRSLGKTYDDLALQNSVLVSELAEQIASKLAKLKK